MSMLVRRRYGAVIVLLLVCNACGTNPNVTLPGFIRPGANRPPQIAQAAVTLNQSGQLELTAAIFEPDGDGLTVNYEQRSGPFALQRSKTSIGGVLTVVL